MSRVQTCVFNFHFSPLIVFQRRGSMASCVSLTCRFHHVCVCVIVFSPLVGDLKNKGAKLAPAVKLYLFSRTPCFLLIDEPMSSPLQFILMRLNLLAFFKKIQTDGRRQQIRRLAVCAAGCSKGVYAQSELASRLLPGAMSHVSVAKLVARKL